MELKETAESVLYPVEGGFASIRVRVLAPSQPMAPKSALFMLHDFVGNSRDLVAFGRFFARQGYRVVLPDMPGRGESAYMAPEHYNMRTCVDVFASVFETYRLQTNNLFGVGWGALIAVLTEMGATAGNIRRLALLNLVSNWSYATDSSLSYWKQLSTRNYKDEAELLEQDAVKNIGLGDLAFHHAISTKLRPADKGVRLAFDPGIFDLLERHDEQEYRLEPLIRALKAPTLLINRHSQLDLFQPHHFAAESDGRRVYLCELRGDGSEPVEDASVVLPVFGFLAAARG